MAHYTTDGIQEGLFKSGGTVYDMKEIWYGGILVWPAAYVGVLVPEWTSSGNIPVTGGNRTLRWQYRIYRANDLTTPVATGYVSNTANVAVTLSDATNFTYNGSASTSANISAGTRGTNGYGTSGTVIPQSAGERSCTITAASCTLTYDNKSVSAVYSGNSFTVTQDANNVSAYGQPSYSASVRVDNFTSSASKAAAGGGSSTWGKSGSMVQIYKFSTNEQYTYTEDVTSQVNVSASQSWVTINNNGTFDIATRGTEPGEEREAVISASIGNTVYDSKTVYQQLNRVEQTNKTYTGATMTGLSAQWGSLAANTVPSAGGSGTLSYTATKSYTSTVIYTSGAPAAGPSGSDPIPFGTGGVVVNSKPSWVTSVGENSITASAQSKYIETNRTGTIYFRAYYDSSHYASYQLVLTQKGTVVTYSIVCVSHPNGVSLPAYASTVNLVFNGSKSYDNGSPDDVTPDVYGEYVSGSDVVEQGVTRISHGVGTVMSGNLGTTPFGAAGTTYNYRWASYTSATCQVAVTQSLNRIESTDEGPWVEGQKQYGTPTTEIKPNSYFVNASIDPQYGSGSPAPKAGGVALLTVSAGHKERTATPWTRTDTQTNTDTWTSREESTSTNTRTVQGTDYDYPDYHTVPDTPTFTVSPATWLSVSPTATAGVYSVGIAANSGSARDGYVYVNNGSAVPSTFHIYQKAGNISILVHDGNNNPISRMNYAGSGGTITVYVAAQSTTWKIVTVSGWPWSTGATFVPSVNTGGQSGTTLTLTIATQATQNKVGQFRVVSDADSDIYYEVTVRQGPLIPPGPE